MQNATTHTISNINDKNVYKYFKFTFDTIYDT